MPIITVQRRMAEKGRIRLGQKVPTNSGRTRPDKLSAFRFTSGDQALIEQIAAKYGGQARPWDNDGKAEFEVLTDAKSIPVIVVKGGFSQWHELWTKGGCKHRCDGEKDPTGAYCNPDDPDHKAAIEKPTTRLSVMLSEIETLGVWRMESKGWNAAAELPSMAELAMHVGDLVPATLSLAERKSIIETPKGPQTSRYVVPVLDLKVTKAKLVEIAGASTGAPALEAGSSDALQLEQAPATERPDYEQMLADAHTVEDCQSVWRAAGGAGHLDDDLKDLITARAKDIKATTKADLGPEPEPVEAVIEPDSADGGATWQDVVAAAGAKGITTSQLADIAEQRFAQPVADLTGEQLGELAAAIEAGDAA